MAFSAAVISFLNVTNGQYRWWDDFPSMIRERLKEHGVEHVCFYRSYHDSSREPLEGRRPAPEGCLANSKWVESHVHPVARRYEKVIFHTHGYYQPIKLWTEVWRHGRARWFWTEHRISEHRRCDWLRKCARAVGQVCGFFPSRVFGVSEAGAKRLREQFRASTVKCIRTGIRLEPCEPKLASANIQHGLFVGRLIEEKRIWPLLHAFAILKKKGVDVTLTIVGQGTIEEAHIAKYIDEHNLGGRVVLTGYQRDPRPYYCSADFIVIPTLVAEALGMVSLEARLHGLPAIYSPAGGLPETQIDGVTGLKLKEPTAEEIAEKIVAIRADPNRYAKMRRDSRRGLEAYSVERMVAAYVEEYLAELADL
jgi:glycosyltransferase involved in cell wall biosynthesis